MENGGVFDCAAVQKQIKTLNDAALKGLEPYLGSRYGDLIRSLFGFVTDCDTLKKNIPEISTTLKNAQKVLADIGMYR